MEQMLEKLFESVPKARILRIFMRNPDAFYTLADIASRSKVRVSAARSEIGKLMKLGIVKQKIQIREIPPLPRAKIKKTKKIKETVYFGDEEFPLLIELQSLVNKASLSSRNSLLRQMKQLGKLKLAVISGVFTGNDTARTDLLLVGDTITKRKLENFVKNIESDIGKSLRYTAMDAAEFSYRMDMYDRFLRDILEYPHEKLINRFDI